jgi:hypothetical protein
MKRLSPLPRLAKADLSELRRRYRRAKDRHEDTTELHKLLVLATCRKMRDEVKQESRHEK